MVQGLLVRKAVKKLGERTCLVIALLTGITGLMAFGFAAHEALLWMALPVFAFLGFFQPSIQGLMTRLVKSDEQGQLQGASGSMQGIAGMIGPILFSSTFSFAIAKKSISFEVPGAPFFVAALLLLSALTIVVLRVKATPPRKDEHSSSPAPEAA
jgi:DHA1 family tetracycline resistance protein-like MFS transporter